MLALGKCGGYEQRPIRRAAFRYGRPSGALRSSRRREQWESFQSPRGSYSASPAPTNIISAWSYTLEVPRTGDENVRINLWLFQGAAPSDQQEAEVIIKSFSFVPLAPPQAAVLSNFNRWPSGQIQFDLQGEPDRRYEL